MLYYVKKGGRPTFNTYAFFTENERDERKGSLNYKHREDVWQIAREYKPNAIKNKNELPHALLEKMIRYSSNENDTVCDFFAGSFSTAKVSLLLGRKAVGFELNEKAYQYQMQHFNKRVDSIYTFDFKE